MDFSIESNSGMKIVTLSSYLVSTQSKSMTIRVTYGINKRLIWWINLVPSPCCVLKLLSCFDPLRGWSRPALAENTLWFSLSFSGEWIHVQANRGCRLRLVFNNCFMVWVTKNQNVWAGAASLLPFARKENQRTVFTSTREKFDWKVAQFRSNAPAESPYLLIRRQMSFCTCFQWPMTSSFEVEVSIICKRAIFPSCKKLIKNIHYAARSYLTITRLLLYIITALHWKQLSQTTIVQKNSCDDSNLTLRQFT